MYCEGNKRAKRAAANQTNVTGYRRSGHRESKQYRYCIMATLLYTDSSTRLEFDPVCYYRIRTRTINS